MRKLPILASVLLLAGCNEAQEFSQLHAMCEQTVPIYQLGQCLQFSLDTKLPNWKNDPHAGYVSTYIAWLDAAGERVVKGEASEADMKQGASQLLQRMRSEATQGNQVDTASRMALFLSGLAIMNSNYSYTAPPQTVTIWSPGSRPISCTESLGTINCF